MPMPPRPVVPPSLAPYRKKMSPLERKQIILPNTPENFLLREMHERLQQGQVVWISFGGRSMQPTISGVSDKVELTPLRNDEPCRVGEVYLFLHENHYVVHRLVNTKADKYLFRGDNCYRCEQVCRQQILARLTAVERADGSVIHTDSDEWRSLSRQVLRRRRVRQMAYSLLNQHGRRWESVVYFVLLAVLMWAPINGVGIPMNNFVLGIRVDHLLHASVYLLCPFFLLDVTKKRRGLMLVVALLIGVFTETVQAILPWRGFDINDLLANFMGNLVGWLLLIPYFRRLRK